MGKYEEALERAKAGKPLDVVFPELKESEDERTRKELLEVIRHCYEDGGYALCTDDYKKYSAYLEKQRESTWTEEDDIFERNILPRILNPSKWTLEQNNADKHYLEEFVDRQKNKFLEKQKEQPSTVGDIAAAYQMGLAEGRKEQKPAEWSEAFEDNIRNLLHDKLTGHSEDGSMSWAISIDDKTLKDIVNGIWFYVSKEVLKYPNKELSQPEWSEEDEKMLSDCIEAVGSMSVRSDVKTLRDWLKSLRPQPRWKPSEEQMAVLYDAISNLKHDNYKNIHVLESLYNVLQKLL